MLNNSLRTAKVNVTSFDFVMSKIKLGSPILLLFDLPKLVHIQ